MTFQRQLAFSKKKKIADGYLFDNVLKTNNQKHLPNFEIKTRHLPHKFQLNPSFTEKCQRFEFLERKKSNLQQLGNQMDFAWLEVI